MTVFFLFPFLNIQGQFFLFSRQAFFSFFELGLTIDYEST